MTSLSDRACRTRNYCFNFYPVYLFHIEASAMPGRTQYQPYLIYCTRIRPVTFLIRVNQPTTLPGQKNMMTPICASWNNDLYQLNTNSDSEFHGKTQVILDTAELHHTESSSRGASLISTENFFLVIPPINQKPRGGGTLNFVIKFKLYISGMTGDLEAKCPLIIGSIPLQQFFNNFSQTPALPLVNNSMSRQVLSDAPPALPLPSQHMPGPSMPVLEPYMPRQPVPWQPVSGQPKSENHISLQVIPPNSGIVESSTTFVPSAPVFPGMQDYPNMPPPSYSQSFFGLKKHDDDADDFNYVPHYVSYGLNNPQQNEEENQ
ncbi:unnamed protein product, partial [Meganyctiphanes norvegica]